jgi:hypothetical protein
MPSMPKIIVENSAPSQGRPAEAVRWSAPLVIKEGATSAIDIGCGRLRNLPILKNKFRELCLFETRRQIERQNLIKLQSKTISVVSWEERGSASRMFDAAFLISVLHIVPSMRTRRALTKFAVDRLAPGGFLITDVPNHETYYARRCSTENQHLDGYLMRWGESSYTFYKNFSAVEFDQFILLDQRLSLFAKHSYDKHIIRIWRKV